MFYVLYQDLSTDEELKKTTPRKPREKKIKERTSPPTTDSDETDSVKLKPNTVQTTRKDHIKTDYDQDVEKVVKSTDKVSLNKNKKEKKKDEDEEKENKIKEKEEPSKSTAVKDGYYFDDAKNNTRYDYETGKLVEDETKIKKEEKDEDDSNDENDAEKEARILEEVRETYDRSK